MSRRRPGLFETRSMLDDVYKCSPDVVCDVSKMVKKSFGLAKMVLKENGFRFWEEVHPSVRAFIADREGFLCKGV